MRNRRGSRRARTALRPIAAILLAGAAASAFDLPPVPDRPYEITEQREPCDAYDPERRPFFGDTHVHTAYSFDASTQDTRNTPADAYRFAKGERIGIQPYDDDGVPLRSIQLNRPLDFVAVSDHSEFLGEVSLCTTPGTWTYWHPMCLAHRYLPRLALNVWGTRTLVLKSRWGFCGDDAVECLDRAESVWADTIGAAQGAYDRSSACSFTSFVGYEWTASVGRGQNLHRNVIFRNARVPVQPISWVDTPSAADLWDRLQAECIDAIPGCDVLTIPHNSNLSGGLMFESPRVSSTEIPEPVTAADAERRARWEPLVEIMQHKGSSECDSRSAVWSNDESCGFEKLPYDEFGAQHAWFVGADLPAPSNFVRWALKEGLRQRQTLGVNSFKYGIIASTDTHIAAPGLTAERGHPGHGGAALTTDRVEPVGFADDVEFGPGGLAVLWAEENTRDSLFAAMTRREAYGTSGTRPTLRFFGGWNYPESMCADPDFVTKGYAGGVPMGGDLPQRESDASPRFAVWATRDAGTGTDAGSDLQRVQIIKGWVDGDEVRERVIDVAGGDNGAGVDPKTCEPYGEGVTSLCAVWADPQFDPDVPAFYYARLLENPTCRWSQYVCNQHGVDCDKPDEVPEALAACCAEDYRPVIQERAWSSPIWFEPN